MFGLPVDTVRKGVMKTHYQLGPHPKWDNHDEKFEFKQVSYICNITVCINFMVLNNSRMQIGFLPCFLCILTYGQIIFYCCRCFSQKCAHCGSQ